MDVVPFYIVCDESHPMGPNSGMNAINSALPEIHSTIASDPLLSDKCRVGLMTFSDTAEELMSLTNLADVVAMPGLEARGSRKFRPVFDLLRAVIDRDVAVLRAGANRVGQPLVLFITCGEPDDGDIWETSHRNLVERTTNPHAPNIIAFGVNGADSSTIGKLGTLGAFVSTSGVSPAGVLAELIPSLNPFSFDPGDAVSVCLEPGSTAAYSA